MPRLCLFNKLNAFLIFMFLAYIVFLTHFGLNVLMRVNPTTGQINIDYRQIDFHSPKLKPFLPNDVPTTTLNLLSTEEDLEEVPVTENDEYEEYRERLDEDDYSEEYDTYKVITTTPFVPRTPLEKRIYVRSAFLVSNNEIRLTVIKHHKNKNPVYYLYGRRQIGIVEMQCNVPQCLDLYSPPCVLVGHIGRIWLNESLTNGTAQNLHLQMDGSDPVNVPIIDVRPKPTPPPHQLGVCLQPIFMFADFSILIQFFEHWLGMGATKFYIYRHSYSNEVKAILDFYQQRSNASIELVDWSNLPMVGEDPNAYVYRLEVLISIFDCVQRARHNVKYIAQTDLDEMFFLNNTHGSIVELMDKQMEKHPDMASASFANFENITSPQDLNLSSMKEIYAENYYFPRPLYSKLIRVPERSLHAHIHYSLANEKQPKSNKEYRQIDVAKEDGYILHMRRINYLKFKIYNYNKTNILSNVSKEWNDASNKRIFGYKFPVTNWTNSGLDILKKVEDCRFRHEKARLKQCHSVFDCNKEMNTSEWFTAPNSWHVL